MRNDLDKRLTALETMTGSAGGLLYVDTRPMNDGDANQAIRQAEREVGRNGAVIVIQNVDERPLPKGASVLLNVQPGYLDKLL